MLIYVHLSQSKGQYQTNQTQKYGPRKQFHQLIVRYVGDWRKLPGCQNKLTEKIPQAICPKGKKRIQAAWDNVGSHGKTYLLKIKTTDENAADDHKRKKHNKWEMET